MGLGQFLMVLRARWRMALSVLVLVVAAATGVTLLLAPQYVATASVLVDVKSPDPIAGMMFPAVVMPAYMATQVDIINSDRVALKVVKALRLDESPAGRDQWMQATGGRGRLDLWLAEALQQKLDVRPSRESNVIAISFKAVDADFAAAVANAFAQAYVNTTIELRVEPARQYAEWFGEQGKELRENFEKAQAKLSAYQQAHGIVANDERVDNETAKLNELSSQLTLVQAQTAEVTSKQRSGAASASLPDVTQNALIQSLKVDIARLEAKLQEMSGNFGKNHPQYQRTEAELASLKTKLELESRNIAQGFSTSSNVSRDKEATLRAALDAQKRKVLQLRHDRDELAVLMRDVEAAQKAYESVAQRINQSRLESQSTQTNVSVLTAAAAPMKPSSPNVLRNILIAVFIGTMLGVGCAFLRELSDRRIRSAEDVVELLVVPVLGVVGKSPARRLAASRMPAMLAFPRR